MDSRADGTPRTNEGTRWAQLLERLRSRHFWRNLALYFCVLSVIGHWIEIPYCLFMDQFGIVDPESLVWDDPFYPFLVYGVGATVCSVALVPVRDELRSRCKGRFSAVTSFFVIATVACMLMELVMGFMLNQPNAQGVYPLWDNSELPLNVLGQAWLVNDLTLGAVATLYTWVVYPAAERALDRIRPQSLDRIAALIVAGFVVLCAVKFLPA